MLLFALVVAKGYAFYDKHYRETEFFTETNTAVPTSTDQSEHKQSTRAIIVGTAFFVLFFAGVVVFFVCNQRKSNDPYDFLERSGREMQRFT